MFHARLNSFLVMIVVSLIYMAYIVRVNSLRAQERAKAVAEGDDKYLDEASEAERHRLGDRHRDFVYTL